MEKKMQGIVIMNARPNGEKFYRQSRRIAEALNGNGVETKVLRNGEFPAAIGKNGEMLLGVRADFAVYLDKDKYLGRMLEKGGSVSLTGLRPWRHATINSSPVFLWTDFRCRNPFPRPSAIRPTRGRTKNSRDRGGEAGFPARRQKQLRFL